MNEQVRVFDKNSINSIWLSEAPDGLELTIDHPNDEMTITLNVRGVRALRLALARYEKQNK